MTGPINITFFLILMIVFIYCCFKSCRKKTYLGKCLGRTFMAINIVFVSYAVNIVSESEAVMEIMCTIEHAAMVFALYFFTKYIYCFVNHRENKISDRISLGIVCLDALVLLTNPVNHLAFKPVIGRGANYTLTNVEASALFYIHIGICAALLIIMIVRLIGKIFSVSKYYNTKYFIVLIMVAAICITEVLCATDNNLIDYSKLLYGFGVILLYNVSYAFSPVTLLKRLQNYIDDASHDAMITYDMDGQILKKNHKLDELFKPEEYKDRDTLAARLDIEKEGVYRIDIGDKVYEVRYDEFRDRYSIHVASGFFIHDVTENEKQLEREHHAAVFDQLTNCYNRFGFFENAKEFMEKYVGGQEKFAIVVSGICNFKGINGLYGTKTGDKILQTIAKNLHDMHHTFPMLYGRTAEGKFSCIVPYAEIDKVVRELNAVDVWIAEDTNILIEMCHGYVPMDQGNAKLEDYYEMALMALANCKKVPRTALEYSQNMADDLQKQQLLLAETRAGVDTHQFYIELQPQIDLKTGKVCGAEALVRWEHPILGKVGPNDFIPLFESNGFITSLDRFVWDQAAATIAKLSDAGLYNGHISVNVSQIDIMNTDVASDMEAIIRKYGIPAEKLHVEITESACTNNRSALISTMNNLRSKGFMVEIDDFGSGYSSLNALMKLPFDIVKLDMMFMREYVPGEKSDVVLDSMAQMIHKLKASIVVEGLENTQNLELATGIGADVAQGYYYSKPVSIQKFVEFVNEPEE